MDKDLYRTLCAMALGDVFGSEPRISRQLIQTLGSPEAVFSLSDKEKSEIFGPYSKVAARLGEASIDKAWERFGRLASEGVSIVGLTDSSYPPLLKECEDCPAVIYVRSSTPPGELFKSGQSVSVVGTRDLSLYGKEWGTRIVNAISRAPVKPTIVSGLAIGVDINAHFDAMTFGLPTIAVLPVGIDSVYPARHRVAAEKIASSPGGALITDFPPGTAPTAYCFLRRNRIIAGLSQSTILVESKEKGGGMLTARLAYGYQRNVFALPGRIDDLRSAGCNRLIREKVAEPVDSLEMLPELLGLGSFDRRKCAGLEEEVREKYSGVLPEDELMILLRIAELIRKTRGISLDGICEAGAMSWQEASRYAGMLENDGFISIDLLQRCVIKVKNC